jgi:hypothetical protein
VARGLIPEGNTVDGAAGYLEEDEGAAHIVMSISLPLNPRSFSASHWCIPHSLMSVAASFPH